MTILIIVGAIIAIGLIKNLVAEGIRSAGDRLLPKWNSEFRHNPVTNKYRKIYTYGKWTGKSYGNSVRYRKHK